MGDIVFNGAELMETKKKDGIAKWEGFLQKMALRVLLVEADDSTRQIITALLRKSNYRVTAVVDGLKAWEVLKGRPRNIDLILTEVDLPSISGFALLSLIMEDEMCKNIPVIMMSLQDSVSTVYKCMMRGAADYLVKPVRINELRNLWQHVWRRKFSTVRCNVTQEESVGQQKIEGTFENDAASTHSTGSMACIQKKGECIEKGSDEQSSGTKPDFESESLHVEDMPERSRQLRGKSLRNDVNMQNQEPCLNYCQTSFINESEAQVKSGSEVAAYKETTTRADLAEDIESGTDMKDGTLTTEVCNVRINSPRHVIDFMSAFSNRKSHSNIGASNYDSSPHLDLSLRRNHPDCFENQELERKFSLRPSDGSAFSRYTNTPRELLQISLNGCSHQKEFKTDSERTFSNIFTACNSETHVATITTQRSVNSLATGHHSKKSVLAAPRSQERLNPVTLPVKITNRNNLCSRYSPASPQTFCAQSGLSERPSPSLASQKEPTFQLNPIHCANAEQNNAAQNYDQRGEHAIDSTNNTVHMMDHELDSQEDRGPISSATDHSASSSFCKGARSRLNSMGYGSACGSSSDVHKVAFGKAASESKNEECFFPSSGSSHQSQREAALSKFRLKRKERCYEKKVRYESRKKLAEQRPRVKGQFVRQVHTEMQHGEFGNHCGNSTNGL